MVIRLVAHGDLLFLDLPPQLSVHPLSHRSGGRHRVVTKDLTQMVEQPGGRQEHIGPARLIEVLQKEVGVLISLFRRFIEIRPGPLPVLFDILSGEVQLSKSVLGVLVSVFGGVGEIGHRFWHVFRDIFPLQIQLSQAVGGAGVPLRCRFFIPGYRLIRSPLTLQELSQCVLGEVISLVSAP